MESCQTDQGWKISNLSGISLEQQAILYNSARLNEAQIKQTYNIKSGAMEDFLVSMIMSKSIVQDFSDDLL